MRINWEDVVVENEVPMSGEEITREVYRQTGVKITRQNISNVLRKALGKIFNKLIEDNKDMRSTDIAIMMFEMLTSFNNVSSVEDAKSFLKLLPVNVRNEIERENFR
jgi:tRNA U54 and U55 pseudouridine synthase Pus10